MKRIDEKGKKHPFRLALVVSRFNEAVTTRLYEGALQRLEELDQLTPELTTVWVPGAVEIPLIAQRLAHSDNYDAVVCLGAVIRGETTHYDYVCEQVSRGCQQVALTTGLPIIFGVLTTENQAQALDRCGGTHGHKGRDAIDCAMEMVGVLRQL